MAQNYYDILGITRDATAEAIVTSTYGDRAQNSSFLCQEIKKAYKKAALTHHPDKATDWTHFQPRSATTSWKQMPEGGDPEKFKECGAAVETLTDDRLGFAFVG